MNNFFLKPKILSIIPARGGSKGIPKKNIKVLGDKHLIAYTIEAAKKSKLIDTLILSSDDEDIINIAKDLNINVPFIRPEHLASDDSGSLEVVQHALDFFEKENQFFDAVLLLQPTTPFRENGFIDLAIDKFFNGQSDALVSVLPVPHQFNPHWVYEKSELGLLKISTGDNEIIKRRQDLPAAFFRDGSIYITKSKVIKRGSLYGNSLSYIESNPKFHVNIDNTEDWKKAESLVSDYIKTQNT